MPFDALLSSLIARHPEVLAVIFCDDEGEMVQMVQGADALDPFEVRVLGATASNWFRAGARVDRAPSESIVVAATTRRHLLLFSGLPDNYYVCVVADRGAMRPLVERSLRRLAAELREEI